MSPEIRVHSVVIYNTGGSPEVFTTHKCETKRTEGKRVIVYLQQHDVITAIGQSYSIDNSQNYGAADEHVTANIEIWVDNKLVNKGINNLSYQIP